jgi:fucose permease
VRTMSSPLLIASAVTSGFAVGFVPSLVDSMRGPLCQQLKGSEKGIDRTVMLFYVVWLPAMPLAGWLIDHWHNMEVLFLGLLACVLGIAWLGLAQSVGALVSSVLVLGAGYSAVATAGIRLMPAALGFTAHSSTIAALNVGFVCVIVGAVAAPALVGWVVRQWGNRQGLLYLSLALVAAAVLVFLARGDIVEREHPVPWRELVGNPRLWLIAAVILLYFALENCLEVWPEPYLKELGYVGRSSTAALLLFWGMFTLARLAAGWLPQTNFDIWLLLALVLSSSIILGNLVGANEYSSGSLGFWATGACYGPLLPGFLALVWDLFPDSSQGLPGAALGMMLALSGLDTLIVRPVMTRLASRRRARTIMRVPTVLGLILAAPLFALALIRHW